MLGKRDDTYEVRLRETIKMLQGMFPEEPNKQFFNKTETQRATGLSYSGIQKQFTFNKVNMISVVNLAAQMLK